MQTNLCFRGDKKFIAVSNGRGTGSLSNFIGSGIPFVLLQGVGRGTTAGVAMRFSSVGTGYTTDPSMHRDINYNASI